MIKFSILSLLLMSGAAAAGSAGPAPIAPDMPQVLIPARDEAVMSLLPPGTVNAGTLTRESSEALMATIREEMDARYSTDIELDEGRIAELISGDYLEQMRPRSSVTFTSKPLDLPTGGQETGQAMPEAAASGMTSFGDLAMTPEGLRALASMTPDQIKAVAAMAELSRNPNAEVGALLAAARPEAAGQAVMNVGNGENLGLVNWYAALDTLGQAYIANDTLAGSEIAIAEGLVVGQLGMVERVEIDGEQVAVTFSSGDVIRSRAVAPLAIGPEIPALGAIGEEAELELLDPEGFGAEPMMIGETEILLSEGAPRRDAAARPLPRPQGLGKAPQDESGRQAKAAPAPAAPGTAAKG